MKSNAEDIYNYNPLGENKWCNHDTIEIFPIFKMAAGAILDFEKKAIVGAWHHPDLISRRSENSKTVLTSNTYFFKVVKLGFPCLVCVIRRSTDVIMKRSWMLS